MIPLSHKQTYLPDLETIQRLAAEIHEENIQRECVEDDEASRVDRRGGPRLLLLAIVKNAVSTLEEWGRRYQGFHGRSYEFAALRRDSQAAYRYLSSDDRSLVTCFRSVCDETGADSEAIREQVLRRLDESAVKALFP